jgi:hypothetical protein
MAVITWRSAAGGFPGVVAEVLVNTALHQKRAQFADDGTAKFQHVYEAHLIEYLDLFVCVQRLCDDGCA